MRLFANEHLNRDGFHKSLWVHNDFIQILSDYRMLRLGVYLWRIKRIMTYFLDKKKQSYITHMYACCEVAV